MANKKTVKKATAKPVEKKVKKTEETFEQECACGKDCKCGCQGGGCARTFKKIIISAIIFALGFAFAQLLDQDNCKHYKGYAMRASFVNGCMDTSKVKCPVLLEKIPTMDLNQDGCIDKDEYRIARKEYKELNRKMNKARREVREEMREAREEMREARDEMREEMTEGMREAQEGLREAQEGLREAQRQLQNAL